MYLFRVWYSFLQVHLSRQLRRLLKRNLCTYNFGRLSLCLRLRQHLWPLYTKSKYYIHVMMDNNSLILKILLKGNFPCYILPVFLVHVWLSHTCICTHYKLWNVHKSFFWIDTVSIYNMCIDLNLKSSKLYESCHGWSTGRTSRNIL